MQILMPSSRHQSVIQEGEITPRYYPNTALDFVEGHLPAWVWRKNTALCSPMDWGLGDLGSVLDLSFSQSLCDGG